MIGTRGVPARYGGFETAVEEIGARLVSSGHQVVVYCRAAGPPVFRGMACVSLPSIRRRSLETLSHSAVSVVHALVRRPDVVVLFNAANAILLPLLLVARIPVIVHVDGLEWKRDKWGALARRWYRLGERLAVRWADAIVADARGIEYYYGRTYGARARYIPYGAPPARPDPSRLQALGLAAGGYHLVVARFEPENHVLEIVTGFRMSNAQLPLVVVGSAPYAEVYTALISEAAGADERIRFLGAVYDQDLLDSLYSGARTYIHGHSVGGTNPSLLRAAGADRHVIAFDVEFNREVAGEGADYFDVPDVLAKLIVDAERRADTDSRGRRTGAEVRRRYDWDAVAADYERLCLEVISG